jgi:HemY protein
VRIETLAAKAPGHIESALAIARAAIDAAEFARAREALESFTAAPTQRVALLMAEIERVEHGDSGRARAWTLRAVRAQHDPVWTADGYVSDRWRPVSPVSGRLDAFQWQTPLAALPSDSTAAIEAFALEEEMLAPPRRVEPPKDPIVEVIAEEAVPSAAQDNSPAPAATAEPSVPAEPEPEPAPPPPPAAAVTPAPAPLFRARQDIPKTARPDIPQVIPIVRAPDDPGIDDDSASDEFREQLSPAQSQAGGWRGFLSRWGS